MLYHVKPCCTMFTHVYHVNMLGIPCYTMSHVTLSMLYHVNMLDISCLPSHMWYSPCYTMLTCYSCYHVDMVMIPCYMTSRSITQRRFEINFHICRIDYSVFIIQTWDSKFIRTYFKQWFWIIQLKWNWRDQIISKLCIHNWRIF